MTEYEALLARLLPARRFGIELGLGRIRDLLDRLGAPDRRLGAIVHVGGTNGKGSTVAMLAALAATHARVATYTSPHLSCLRERIAIGGEPIDEGAIVAAARAVRDAGGDRLTFFEQLTAIACVAIADARVAVTVLEVGLGGRLDATNAIDAPIAVVTGVALDHEAILGGTLARIAAEKAGIWKRGQRVVIGASGEPAAVPLLDAAARAAGASVITVIDDAAVAAVPPLGLAGAHQRRNAAAALAALDQLEALGVVRVPPEARARALAGVRHPGRFEVVAGAPQVILDGAHNPHGARALAALLAERALRPVLVAAVSADKDVAAIAAALAPAVRAVIATRYGQERALPPAELAEAFRRAGGGAGGAGGGAFPVEEAPDLPAALDAARRLAAPEGAPILVAGSLFLVGEARVLLLGAPADPIAVSDPAAVAAPALR
ncbi:MAG TPA: cyanophycin synthetase [Kofleriaceae bacterium]|nr:cyanophycin synthetase [Kofleriaceae bacterium]